MKSEHVDANLLAAFAEGKLLRHDRDEVLAHLAECADCREIVALASRPAHQAASAQPVSQLWRWAAAVAAVALVLIATWGLRLVLRSPEKAAATRRSAAVKPEIATNAPALGTPPVPQLNKSIRTQRSVIAPKRFIAPANPVVAPPRSSAPIAQPPAAKDEISRSIALPPAPASAAVSQETPAPDELSKPAALPGSPAAPSISRGTSLNEAKSHAQYVAPSTALASMARKTAMSNPHAMWRIGAMSLERSSDGGKTWNPVPVSAGVQFHVVAADGLDVWAGGSHGVIFHSVDGGLTWSRVTVTEGTKELTGSIVAIRLPQPSAIILETDSGEQWISGDGGRRWRRL
jgi:hypothetical protein